MKQSIIFKILLILSIVIIGIFFASSYLFTQSDNKLINEIREYNLNSAMNALDERQNERIKLNNRLMEENLDMIVKNSTPYLIDFDKEGLKKSLKFDMQKEGIMAVLVWDSVVGENFLKAVRVRADVVFNQDLVESFEIFVKLKKDVIYNGDKVGEITLYYDESYIFEQINNLRKETKKAIKSFNEEIDEQKKRSNIIKLFIFVGALVSILALIFILLINLVNKPLKKVQAGLDEFFLFLQNKKDNTQKIDLDTNDEFGAMAHSLNDNISVSAKLHEEIHELNTNLEQRIDEKTKKVTTLLDNAGQGFLTFDDNFIVNEEYSKECEKLLGEEISFKDISELLFVKAEKREFFKSTLLTALDEKVDIKRNSYLSLLPSIILLNKKALRLEYKIIDVNKFMLILTNITSQKKLERKVKKEQEILKMIVSIVSESQIFYDTKSEYIDFIDSYGNYILDDKTPLHNITEIYRKIHTFKGSFSQLYMQDIVDMLHKVESEISNLQKEMGFSNKDIINLIESFDFKTTLNKSLSIIEEILGSEFLETDNYLKIDLCDITDLQSKIEKVLGNSDYTTPECQDILSHVQKLSNQKLIKLFHPFVISTKQLAKRLDKEIYDFEIIGDSQFSIGENFKPFVKSLVHVFRNCIDHGIEMPELRLEKQKDEKGTISCSFEEKDERLFIIISDDGAGVDIEKLKSTLLSSGIDINKLSEKEILNHIFTDNISTKESISNISGRGVGMSAVKDEIEKLNGKINISSQKDVGTTFEFIIPLEQI